jgi:hypothetical protein
LSPLLIISLDIGNASQGYVDWRRRGDEPAPEG